MEYKCIKCGKRHDGTKTEHGQTLKIICQACYEKKIQTESGRLNELVKAGLVETNGRGLYWV